MVFAVIKAKIDKKLEQEKELKELFKEKLN